MKRVVIEDEMPADVVDYRVRCVVHNGQFDRVYYGITAAEYDDGCVVPLARDVCDTFDHSAGRGRRGATVADVPQTRYFFTPGLGRHDEIATDKARGGRIRR